MPCAASVRSLCQQRSSSQPARPLPCTTAAQHIRRCTSAAAQSSDVLPTQQPQLPPPDRSRLDDSAATSSSQKRPDAQALKLQLLMQCAGPLQTPSSRALVSYLVYVRHSLCCKLPAFSPDNSVPHVAGHATHLFQVVVQAPIAAPTPIWCAGGTSSARSRRWWRWTSPKTCAWATPRPLMAGGSLFTAPLRPSGAIDIIAHRRTAIQLIHS